ncbi:MAG: methionyl-tRNA formyltransferase, partial [Patescibacteria group bacterium]|nr:methionyl-tRNA formyltransferase [Patescibacteria group bacterium]
MNNQKKSPSDNGSGRVAVKEIRFAFFGTPHLATVFLDDLEKSGLVPSLVVTTPDAPQGRGKVLASPPIKEWAESRGIRTVQPETLDDDFAEQLSAAVWDVFVVIYYGKILPKGMLEIPKRGTLNIHFSLLPRWRGTSPVRAAIANDDGEIGTSIILLDEQIDHGPVIAQKRIAMLQPDGGWPPSASDAEETATHESARLLAQVMPAWISGEIEAREQNHDLATHCPAYTKDDGLLDLYGDAYKNLLKIRAFDSTVGTHAFFERGGKRLRVQILEAHLDGKTLVIDLVKPEGKREMSYEEFL